MKCMFHFFAVCLPSQLGKSDVITSKTLEKVKCKAEIYKKLKSACLLLLRPAHGWWASDQKSQIMTLNTKARSCTPSIPKAAKHNTNWTANFRKIGKGRFRYKSLQKICQPQIFYFELYSDYLPSCLFVWCPKCRLVTSQYQPLIWFSFHHYDVVQWHIDFFSNLVVQVRVSLVLPKSFMPLAKYWIFATGLSYRFIFLMHW